eukprot:CAMPEP_0119275726 /NCGR_PEP_ID=MMETSP1329-20130426/14301_1 /TAXON_ID=114041 /ORGANISM="Genus nov. species nov., Strain RCC1024" /LENGTH=261 /DNA_ID=CAMNT_0007276135 /DNA_START=156 /DNA_END=938 /DNA_ORIENTATION=+
MAFAPSLRAAAAVCFLWTAASAINYDSNNFDDLFGEGGQAHKCVPFSCAKGKEAVPKKTLRLEAKSGGCDSMGGGGMNMFSAKQSDNELNPCCLRRMACENLCGTSLRFCEDELKKCTTDMCANSDDPAECGKKKSMVELMGSMDGGKCQRHAKAQAAACNCVAPEEAAERRLKVLTDAYKKHGAEEDPAKKAEGLVAKANTKQKFAALLHKLMAKFPQMIRQVKDPQQAYFENIMKEAERKREAAPDVVEGEVEDEDVED